ncbi:uncharacterized protein LOC119725792 [Patiria miniata]|uniref:Uncharacterized protein n=1 Tax=Patiria miniata TaxID=46514 RepID=A0A913ZPJ8_PATMI|nr:uncharacterized protein LOC119725792 [Patiria miniata]XP_038053306.1 uncharacterized protein LOC119725792 [Patiria miniata]
MSTPAENSSPAEPQLLSVKEDRPDSASRSSTGPSPVMPSLSPYPLAGESCSDKGDFEVQCPTLPHHPDKTPDRRKPAKKMLDFGDAPLMQGDDEVRPMEDGEQSLESAGNRGAHSPRNREDKTAPESNSTNHPPASPFGSPHIQDADTGHEITMTPSPQEASTLKRPHSVSPGEIHSKCPCLTSPDAGDFTQLKSTSTSDKLAADLEPSAFQSQATSPPMLSGNSGLDTLTLDVVQNTELGDVGDPQDVLRCNGINLFGDPAHRQELISFCEQSLIQTNEYSADLNNNNNNSNESDGHYDSNPTAHDKLDSVVQRARARGFQVSDAVYFDGKQYVPIKVAANGRGKFRLLLPPDHPHRRGVAEEIPIFTTFDLDSREASQVEEDENEQLQESN